MKVQHAENPRAANRSSYKSRNGGRERSGDLQRTTFKTSRLLDFCSQKELVAQTGHKMREWPLVIIKELLDNALDACEDAGVAPRVTVAVNKDTITVRDNGPGLPASTIEGLLDFTVRVSNREAYCSPTRGAQGNALKTVLAMPYVLGGGTGRVDITAHGIRHEVRFRADHIRQEPVIERTPVPATDAKMGTIVTVHWPDSACSIVEGARARFLQIADDYCWLNPHLTLILDWQGSCTETLATDTGWSKWLPSDPTCAHWYDADRFSRLVRAYIAHDTENGSDRTVRAFLSEFRGFTGSAAQKKVLDTCGLSRVTLSELAVNGDLDHARAAALLDATKQHSKPVKPPRLGIIGESHLSKRFEAAGCQMESFNYRKTLGVTDGLPWVVEAAFGWIDRPDASRRLLTGVNWSPGIVNPFRQLGPWGQSCDTILANQRVDADEPVIVVLHMTCPRVQYTDRGKSAVALEEEDDFQEVGDE